MPDLTALQQYELAREQIRHEDGLVNNRTTWLLVFQGLLFAAFFQAIGLFEAAKLPNTDFSHKLLVVALCILCILGICSAVAAAFAFYAAHKQIQLVRVWWSETLADVNVFPAIMGTPGPRLFKSGISGSVLIGALGLVWSGLMILLLVGAWH